MGKGMSKVLSGLYVGNFADSNDNAQLSMHGVTHILSTCNIGNTAPYNPDITRMTVDIEDRPTESISPHFLRCVEFIHRARADGGVVLVHCVAGISRSVTITAAYLLTISNLSWREALSCIRAARSVANPNLGFQKQLQDWCETERQRFVECLKGWPRVPFNDNAAIAKLLEKHERWIETGEHEEDKLYPLAPGAYQTNLSGEASLARPTPELTKGEKARGAVRERLRSTIISERRYDARTAELEVERASANHTNPRVEVLDSSGAGPCVSPSRSAATDSERAQPGCALCAPLSSLSTRDNSHTPTAQTYQRCHCQTVMAGSLSQTNIDSANSHGSTSFVSAVVHSPEQDSSPPSAVHSMDNADSSKPTSGYQYVLSADLLTKP